MSNKITIELELKGASGMTVEVKKAGKAIEKLGLDSRSAAKGLNKAEHSVSSLMPKIRDLSVIVGLARHAFVNMRAVVFDWQEAIIGANADLERMSVLLKGMSKATTEEGAIADAAKDMNLLIDTAKTAPFAIDEVGNSIVKMRSVGIEPADGALRSLLDAVANFGGTDQILHRATVAIQQMAGKGVISMEELRQQLGEAVPNAMVLMARSMGISVGKLVKEISKGSVLAKPALERLFVEFELAMSGSADRMMNTWTGLTQRLSVSWKLFLKQIGDAGMFEAWKDAVREFIDVLDSDQMSAFAQEVGSALKSVADSVVDLIHWFRENSMEIRIWIGNIWEAIKVLGLFWAAGKGLTILAAVGVTIGRVVAGLLRLKTTVMAAVGVFRVAATGFIGARVAVAGLTLGLRGLIAGLLGLTGPIGLVVAGFALFGDKLPFVGEAIETIVNWLKQGVEWMLNLGTSAEDMADAIISSGGKAATQSGVDKITQEAKEARDELTNLADEWIETNQRLKDLGDPSSMSANTFFGEFQDLKTRKDEILAERKKLHEKLLELDKAAALGAEQVAIDKANALVKIEMDRVDDLSDEYRRNIRNELNSLAEKRSLELISQEEYWTKRREVITENLQAELEVISQSMQDQQQMLMLGSNEEQRKAAAQALEDLKKKYDDLSNGLQRILKVQKEVQANERSTGTSGVGKSSFQKLNAYQRFVKNLKGNIEELRGKVAGLDGAWEEFLFHAQSGKFKGLVPDGELPKMKALFDEMEKLKQQYKDLKEQRKDLADISKKLTTAESQLQRELEAMSDELNGTARASSKAMTKLDIIYQQLLDMKPATAEAADEIERLKGKLEELKDMQGSLDAQKQLEKQWKEFQKLRESQASLMKTAIEVRHDTGYKTDLEYLREREAYASRHIALLQHQIELMQAAGAKEYEINRIREQILQLTGELNLLADKFREIFEDSFSTFFEDILGGTKSFGDAFKSLWQNIFKEINSIVARELSQKLMRSLFASEGALKPGGDAGFFGDIANLFMPKENTASTGSIFSDFGGFIGGFIPSLFARGGIMSVMGEAFLGKYESGGVASMPKFSMFAEGNVPEAYVPLQDGRSIPVTQDGGDRATTINFNFPPGTDARKFRESKTQIMADVHTELTNARRRRS